MLKKIMLLGAAIAALVAIAAPAAQAEFEWETTHIPITEHDTVTLSGQAEFELTNETAGAKADVAATITLFDGTHFIGDEVATVEEFHVSNCVGLIGLKGTTCTPTTTTQDWPVFLVAENTLEIVVNLHQLYWAGPHTGTPVATTLLTGGVTAEIEEGGEIGTVQLSPGVDLTANAAKATVRGALEYTGPHTLQFT